MTMEINRRAAGAHETVSCRGAADDGRECEWDGQDYASAGVSVRHSSEEVMVVCVRIQHQGFTGNDRSRHDAENLCISFMTHFCLEVSRIQCRLFFLQGRVCLALGLAYLWVPGL